MSYRVSCAGEVYGYSDTQDGAQAIVNMHRTTKSGHRKESKIATMAFKVEMVQGEYPPKDTPKIVLGYKPGGSATFK